MAGGYRHRPDGVEGLAAKIGDLQRQINEIRSAAGIKSATVGEGGFETYSPSTGRRSRVGTGEIYLFPDSTFDIDHAARLYAQAVLPNFSQLRISPPWVDTDDFWASEIVLTAAGQSNPSGSIEVFTGRTEIQSRDLILDLTNYETAGSGAWTVYGLATTSSSANLRYNPSTFTVGYVSSSLRYKQDVEDAEVNPREVIQLTAKTWRDKHEVEHDPNTEKRNVGFIAEELDEHPTLRQFVDYDDEGRPDAIQYDRLSVALLAVVKEQDERLAAIEARLDALDATA